MGNREPKTPQAMIGGSERKREMTLWKANQLRSKADVTQRGIFRFVWCAIGWMAATVLFMAVGRPIQQPVHILALVILIPLIGMAVDAARLKPK